MPPCLADSNPAGRHRWLPRVKEAGTNWQKGWPGLPCDVLGKTRTSGHRLGRRGQWRHIDAARTDVARDEYLTCGDPCYWCHGNESGLIKPLPVQMIAAIDNV